MLALSLERDAAYLERSEEKNIDWTNKAKVWIRTTIMLLGIW